MRAIENGSQQRVRTVKSPIQEGDERGAQELHLPHLVDHQQGVRLPKPRLDCPHTYVLKRRQVDRILPHLGSWASNPGEWAAPAVERNDIEAQPAAVFAASQLFRVEPRGRVGQQAPGSEDHGRLATTGWSGQKNPQGISQGFLGGGTMTLSLTSPAFAPNGDIPKEYTCDGKDLAPPLEWSGAPAGTKSFALIVDDPDAPDPKAPKTTWVHWVVYDIPASVTALPKTATAKDLPAGTREGVNDWKRTGYGGPCPPIGRHRYFHKLYALDAPLGDLGRPTKAALERAMQGHLLAKAELVGKYQRGT
jgi:Raf kinase inhibitor-like YbhB/YbcL family protein